MGTKITELSQVASRVTTSDFLLVSNNNGSGVYTSKKATQSDLFAGWSDLLGQIYVRGTGQTVPAYEQVTGSNFWAYNFAGTGSQTKEVQCDFHLDHRYQENTDLYIHMHWFPNSSASGDVKWYFDICYARGYARGVYPIATPTTVSVVTAAPGVAYTHMISEVVFTNAGGTGGLIDRALIETDGIVMVRAYRNPADVADTYTNTAWATYCDIHFQSNKVATPNRNYPFA